MANYHASITMALPKGEVPEPLSSLDDLSPLWKPGEALASVSRKNWLIYAVGECALHYGCPRLSYLSQPGSVLDPVEADRTAQELNSLLKAIEQNPPSLCVLLSQDAWSPEEIRALLRTDAVPWGPLVDPDGEGEELPYLLSFLVCQLAILRHAANRNLFVAFAQSTP